MQTDGNPKVELNAADSAHTSFAAPNVDSNQEFVFRLTVTDNDGNEDSDQVSVLIRDSNNKQNSETNSVVQEPPVTGPCDVNDTNCNPVVQEPPVTGPCDVNDTNCNPVVQEPPVTGPCDVNDTNCNPVVQEPPVTGPCDVNDTNCNPVVPEPPVTGPCDVNDTNCNPVVPEPPVTGPCDGNDTNCNPVVPEPPVTGPCDGNDTNCNLPPEPVPNCPDNFGNMTEAHCTPVPPVTCTDNETDCTPTEVPPIVQPCINNETSNQCPTPNRLPIADAGKDQVVDEGLSVTLGGNKSHDSKGNVTSYSWIQTGGVPLVTVEAADSPNPFFIAPQVDTDATLKFELTVANAVGDTDTDEVNIAVRNVNNTNKTFETSKLKASIVDIMSDTAVGLTLPLYSINGTEVSVEKMDSSPDFSLNNSAVVELVPVYPTTELQVTRMNLVSNNAQSINLNSIDKDKWILDAPIGTYSLLIDAKYVPGDGTAHYGIPIQIIGKKNMLPVANAGTDRVVKGNVSVILDGSKSFDPDGNISSYHWLQVNGEPFVTIADVDTPKPSFVSPANIKNDTNLRPLN